MRRPMRRLLATAAVLASLAVLGSCGDAEEAPAPGGSASESTSESASEDGSSAPADSASASPEAPGAQTIEVTVEGGKVTPNGDRVEVERGTDVELVVTADEPGEIHVHSSPEQELRYAAGTTTLLLALADQPPGIVDVESHNLEQTIVQLEIR